MTIQTIIYDNYYPKRVKIESIAIGVGDDTLSDLYLDNTARLIVGEQLQNKSGEENKYYSLIVDDHGLGVNTTLETRSNYSIGTAVYIDGDVVITGKVLASNYYPLSDTAYNHLKLGDGDYYDFESNVVQGDLKALGLIGAVGFWLWSDNKQLNNIYHLGRATIGNKAAAESNLHGIQVYQNANRNIYQTQIGIQNTQMAELRMGILGNCNTSPAIFNTNPNTKIEFHAGRDASYFNQMYNRLEYTDILIDNHTGEQIALCNIAGVQFPDYETNDAVEYAPHLQIDEIGNVGIHTSANINITYQGRVNDGSGNISLPTVVEPATLHVEGTTYGKTLLVYDPDSSSICNIDTLYVRKKGITLLANQIIPGPFAYGEYEFPGSVTVDSNFNVDTINSGSLNVSGYTSLNVANVSNIIAGGAYFSEDVYMQQDLTVNNSLLVKSGIFVQAPDNNGNLEWNAVQFKFANSNLDSINYFGAGITTPGKMGVGVNNTADDVWNQMTIVKRDEDTYELSLLDKSHCNVIKAAFLGHPYVERGSMPPDGSLVIATPSPIDTHYIKNYDYVKQNIYFFPGNGLNRGSNIINPRNIPVMSVCAEKNVGINTYNPQTELDVNGSIMFSGNLIYNNLDTQELIPLGIWKAHKRVDTSNLGLQYVNGIQYIDPMAPYVGINTPVNINYILDVGGKIRAQGGYYTPDDRPIGLWLDSDDPFTVNQYMPQNVHSNVFTWGNVGIGVTTTTAPLEIKNNYGKPSSIKITKSENDYGVTNVEFAEISSDPTQSWFLQANHTFNRFEIAHTDTTFNSNSWLRALWVNYNPQVEFRDGQIDSYTEGNPYYNVYINADINMRNRMNTSNFSANAALSVNGDLNVVGNVFAYGYNLNGRVLINENIATNSNELNLGENDVFIGGGHIILCPDVTSSPRKTVMIGSGLNADSTIDSDSLLRLYQTSTEASNAVVCSLRNAGSTALIKLVAESSLDTIGNGGPKELRFGVYNPRDTNGMAFRFADEFDRPYISFQTNSQGNESSVSERYVGFNTDAPGAMIHVSTTSTGTNMLRLTTNISGLDTSRTSPALELERFVPTVFGNLSHKWLLKGPDASYNNKLCMIYQDTNNDVLVQDPSEVFTFTADGCIGIGNTEPEYALDVFSTGSKGSLRLRNSAGSDACPQIVLQSGNPVFGNDQYTDFNIFSSNNEFKIVAENTVTYQPLIHVNSSNRIGIGSDIPTKFANCNFEVNVVGAINVTEAIFLNGSLLYSAGDLTEFSGDFVARGPNIYIRPQTDVGGGLIINNKYPTGNLMHIYSGNNANMMVLESALDECQLHFRTNMTDMWREGSDKKQFYWEYSSNQNDVYVPDSHDGYIRTMSIQPSEYTNITNDFDLLVNGKLLLNSVNPSVCLGNTNSNLCISSINGCIGIGTLIPKAGIDIYTSNLPIALNQIAGYGDILQLWTYSPSNDTWHTPVVINNIGNIGIGSTEPRGLEVWGRQIYASSTVIDTTYYSSNELLQFGLSSYIQDISFTGTFAPGYSFVDSPYSGMAFIHSQANLNAYGSNYNFDSIDFAINGYNTTTISEDGGLQTNYLSLNNYLPETHNLFANYTSCNTTLIDGVQNYNGDIVRLANSTIGSVFVCSNNGTLETRDINITGSIIPTSNSVYTLGSPDFRWKDIYVSGNTIDIQGTTLSADEFGNIIVQGPQVTQSNVIVNTSNFNITLTDSNILELKRLIIKDLQVGDSNNPIIISNNGNYNISFTSIDPNTGCNVVVVPLTTTDVTVSTFVIGGLSNYQDSTLHLYTASNLHYPSLIIEQFSDCNVVEIYNHDKEIFLIDKHDNTNIFSSLNVINSNGLFKTLNVTQNGENDIALFSSIYNSNCVLIDKYGNVGINTSIANSRLHVVGTQLFDGWGRFTSNVRFDANIEIQGNCVTHGDAVTDSDKNLKEDLVRIENALEKVNKLTGYTFTRINDNRRSTGLIAQDVLEVLPEAVDKVSHYHLGVMYGNLMGLIVEAIKELSEEIKEIKSRLV